MMTTCKYCGRQDEGNAGDYYHRKACEATSLRQSLQSETDPKLRKKLQARLEMAEFVGD
jgi:hypothetical protein